MHNVHIINFKKIIVLKQQIKIVPGQPAQSDRQTSY
jgi:hypothetical protein